jgi:hypothetical protein
MFGVPRAALQAIVCLAVLLGSATASAQSFGRNKVEYVDFEFKLFETEHFDVYYYATEEESARRAARLAERWYARLSRVLNHSLGSRQPLILYGSQPEFSQTNVVAGLLSDGIGGVTESSRRRIVMPLAPTLAETDHVLGHEIAHAFQFDITRRTNGSLAWPLWAVEGMAEYLSLGSADSETAMWLRDAVAFDLLPKREYEATRRFSPYRYGAAMWAYLAARFGDAVMGNVLKAGRSGTFERQILQVTGFTLEKLFNDWRAAAAERYAPETAMATDGAESARVRAKNGRLQLGPSLSPDGHRAIFYSERDHLSIDLYLADTTTGSVTRKLATTTGAARFESLQAIRSAGSWSPDGNRFVFAAITKGKPALVLLDVSKRNGPQQQIVLPTLGQILSPAWSPDGRSIAFSAVVAGVTDLFIYDLGTGVLRQLTHDPYADLQPAWSPDGRRIAFVTERFSTDLNRLTFGPCELAIVDVSSGAIEAIPAVPHAKHMNPQWAGDGNSLYFVSDPAGVSNVYRVGMEAHDLYQITHVPAGVTGLAPTSPALSVARDAPVIAFTVYRGGAYALEIRRGPEAMLGEIVAAAKPPDDRPQTIGVHSDVTALLQDSRIGLPSDSTFTARPYPRNLSLEAIGPPYLSSGGGPLGNFVRGGGSLLFGDVLGERKLAMSAQVGNHLRDLGLGVQYLNRERRWNWGAIAEVQPSLRRLPQRLLTEHDGQATVSSESHYFERMQLRMAGLFAYPLNQSDRFEFEGGVRHIRYRETVYSTVRSLQNGRLVDRQTTTGSGGAPANLGEVSTAFVRDTAAFGATGPIAGSRRRLEARSDFGDLSYVRLLLDERRYAMPVKPYTIATRILHLGQYGPDADDPRLLPAFLGSRQFVHGYSWGSLKCPPASEGNCEALEDLLGSRLVVANLELRVPVLGIRARDIRYGPVPLDAFIFADGGVVWSQPLAQTLRRERHVISSVGAGVRINAFGIPIEWAVVRALNAPARGWTFDFGVRPGF